MLDSEVIYLAPADQEALIDDSANPYSPPLQGDAYAEEPPLVDLHELEGTEYHDNPSMEHADHPAPKLQT